MGGARLEHVFAAITELGPWGFWHRSRPAGPAGRDRSAISA
ncbi:hypothetical protein AB0940_20920 [Streptomyces sp. NPDC006656]